MAANIGKFGQLYTRENVARIVSRRLAYMKEFWMNDVESSQTTNTSTWENLSVRIRKWIQALSAEKSAVPQLRSGKPAATEQVGRQKPSAPQHFVVNATEMAAAERPPTGGFGAALK